MAEERINKLEIDHQKCYNLKNPGEKLEKRKSASVACGVISSV